MVEEFYLEGVGRGNVRHMGHSCRNMETNAKRSNGSRMSKSQVHVRIQRECGVRTLVVFWAKERLLGELSVCRHLCQHHG